MTGSESRVKIKTNICSRPKPNKYIPENELELILQRADPRYRDFYVILVETGYRVEDALSVRRWQLMKAAATRVLALTEAKTGKYREVPLTETALKAVESSLKACKGVHPFNYVFESLRFVKRAKRHRSTVYRQFILACKRAGYNGKGYTIHSLRKVYAHRLYDRVRSLRMVQDDLNHDSPNTTRIYLSDLED